MTRLVSMDDVLAAQQRTAGVVVRSPMVRLTRARMRVAGFRELSETAADLYLKDESAQPIGSFKLRGAYNKIASLTPDELRRGVITYSSGNHAQGVAFAARALGAKAVIVMPASAPRIKRDATAALGAEIVEVGNASIERRLKAEELAAAHGYTMVPPYDDEAIIAGQATCGVEILGQMGWCDSAPEAGEALVLAPVSGGGLLSGVATAIKTARFAPAEKAPAGAGQAATAIPVFGCEPALAGDASESFRTRTLVEWPAEKTTRTLADGLRTQSLGQRNFEHVMEHVDGIVTVSEEEIRTALGIILTVTAVTAEPSGAVTLAAALFHAQELPAARKVVCVMSGGNLDPALRAEILDEMQARQRRSD